MSNKNKPEWELAILSLVQPYENVGLMCDGVNILIMRIESDADMFLIFIEKEWKCSYSNRDDEMGKKFGNPVRVGFDRSFRLRILKGTLGAVEIERRIEEHENIILMYSQIWSDSNSLVEKLNETCTKIKLANGIQREIVW